MGAPADPPLGPRQAKLVDALTVRLRNGPPMEPSDTTVALQVMRILGLPR